MRLNLSHLERSENSYWSEIKEVALQQIYSNGYIILEDAVPRETIDRIRNAYDDMLEKYIEQKGDRFRNKRIQIPLPFVQPFIDEELICNPYAAEIVDQILGEDHRCIYFSSDTPMPGSEVQNVHCDVKPLFPNLPVALPPFALTVGISLTDVNEENAPLEVWPGGTHLNPLSLNHDFINESVSQHLQIIRSAETMHSEKLRMSAGSILIRDIRMWHRGTANLSDQHRTIISLIYSKSWYGYGSQIQIPKENYETLSERSKQLFRFEKIGYPAKMPWEK